MGLGINHDRDFRTSNRNEEILQVPSIIQATYDLSGFVVIF